MAQAKDDLYSRPPLERMLGIHEQLQARRFPNCAKLARQFEVAIRTIMRDIEFMSAGSTSRSSTMRPATATSTQIPSSSSPGCR
jgi:DeoR/GlpR family transcriptional regulator of sugar metabolism